MITKKKKKKRNSSNAKNNTEHLIFVVVRQLFLELLRVVAADLRHLRDVAERGDHGQPPVVPNVVEEQRRRGHGTDPAVRMF
jgi:hypothetical protein